MGDGDLILRPYEIRFLLSVTGLSFEHHGNHSIYLFHNEDLIALETQFGSHHAYFVGKMLGGEFHFVLYFTFYSALETWKVLFIFLFHPPHPSHSIFCSFIGGLLYTFVLRLQQFTANVRKSPHKSVVKRLKRLFLKHFHRLLTVPFDLSFLFFKAYF